MKLRRLIKAIFGIKRSQTTDSINFMIWGGAFLSFRYNDQNIDMFFCPIKKRILSIPRERVVLESAPDPELLSLIANLETLQLIRKNKESSF